MRVKATSTSLPDPGKKERDELKQWIQELAAELARKEKEGQGNRQWRRRKNPSGGSTDSTQSSLKSKGPGVSSAGPFHGERQPCNVGTAVDGDTFNDSVSTTREM